MFNYGDFIAHLVKKAVEHEKDRLIAEGRYFPDEGVVLTNETVELMKEIENFHKQNAIDRTLATGDKATFLKLTGEVNA